MLQKGMMQMQSSIYTSLCGNSRTPVELDPATHPIIARHWFGVEPLRPIGAIAAEVVVDRRFRHKVRRLHGLGDRVVGEAQ